MIIVEGPDGSAKTTLIQTLGYTGVRLKALRGGVGGSRTATPAAAGDGLEGWGIHKSAFECYTSRLVETEEVLSSDINLPGCPTVKIAFDRFHLSEVVYGPLLRGTQELPQGDLFELNKFLRRRMVPVVLCLPPFAVTLANVARDGRERPAYQTEGFLHQAWKAFEALQPYATIVYDYTKDPLPAL